MKAGAIPLRIQFNITGTAVFAGYRSLSRNHLQQNNSKHNETLLLLLVRTPCRNRYLHPSPDLSLLKMVVHQNLQPASGQVDSQILEASLI